MPITEVLEVTGNANEGVIVGFRAPSGPRGDWFLDVHEDDGSHTYRLELTSEDVRTVVNSLDAMLQGAED
jgi:hypothetical protein